MLPIKHTEQNWSLLIDALIAIGTQQEFRTPSKVFEI